MCHVDLELGFNEAKEWTLSLDVTSLATLKKMIVACGRSKGIMFAASSTIPTSTLKRLQYWKKQGTTDS